MYFWTNTPDQAAFIEYAAQINELAAFIRNPNTPEGEAENYRASLTQAKNSLANTFQLIQQAFLSWLESQGFYYPTIYENGDIWALPLDLTRGPLRLRTQSYAVWSNGEAYFWIDIYRMMILNAFLGRATPPPGEERWDVKEMHRV